MPCVALGSGGSNFAVESVATLPWNERQLCYGIRGNFGAEYALLRGFTTVRDMGGPAFGLKRAIDEGIIAGPRIYPSGALITITSGHGDFRQPFELPRVIGAPLSRTETTGGAMIADSPDEVR